MSSGAGLPWLILAAVAGQRLLELAIARRNTRALLARGGFEVGAAHYPFIVAVHSLWLIALAVWVAGTTVTIAPLWLVLYMALQGARIWVMRSLGPYWTTRIIAVPDAPLVRQGPYRFLSHPNYAVVVAEIAVLPMVFGAWQLALTFSLLNAVVLWVRLRAEATSLRQRASSAAGSAGQAGSSHRA